MVVGQDLTPDWVKKIGTMLAEIFRQLYLGLKEPGKGLSLEQLQLFIEHRNPFAKVATKLVDAYEHIRRDWEKFYKDNFNLTVDFSGVRIPNYPGIGWRLLIIAQGQGITLEQVFRAFTFKTWKWTDRSLDDVVVENERDSKNGAYAIWVRDEREADEVHKNKSANQVKAEKLSTETPTERLVHEFKYFQETGKHLDVDNITLCSGSRCRGGNVPLVLWHRFDDELRVDWYLSGNATDRLRAREVVS